MAYQPNPHHRRAKLMGLTPAGCAALGIVQRRHAVWAKRLARQPALEQVATLLTELRAVRECLERDEQTVPGSDHDDQPSG